MVGVRGPDGGDERQGQILELLALLRGEPVGDTICGVPPYRRRTYAMAAKKASGNVSVTYADALEVALVWVSPIVT